MLLLASVFLPAAGRSGAAIVGGGAGADLSVAGGFSTAGGFSVIGGETGVVVKPSLPLRDAVALSKDLAVDGLKVQVRRAAGASAPAPPAGGASASGGDPVYRVRVGPFDDRAAATSTLRELVQRGYAPFLARGGQ